MSVHVCYCTHTITAHLQRANGRYAQCTIAFCSCVEYRQNAERERELYAKIMRGE